MLTDRGQEFGGLCYQLFAFDYLVLQFLAVLEIAGILFLPLLIVIDGFNRQVRYEEVDIGLDLVQLLLQVQNVKGWIKKVVLLGHCPQELNSKAYSS